MHSVPLTELRQWCEAGTLSIMHSVPLTELRQWCELAFAGAIIEKKKPTWQNLPSNQRSGGVKQSAG
jgi:hypothetical protein